MAVAGMNATVTVAEADGVRIGSAGPPPFEFDSIERFVSAIDRFGYGTGEQLLAATLRTFVNLARSQEWSVPDGVDIRYETSIPRSVGLAGSSALVIALIRGLLELCGRQLPARLLPALALSVEVDQLGITAGLQDRVVQCFGGLVAMDFGSMSTDARTGLVYGRYEELDPASLPRLFLAMSNASAEPSDAFHRVLRSRFDAGDAATLTALHELAGLVPRGKAALRWGGEALGPLMARNMAIRAGLAPLAEEQLTLVDAARQCGLHATFAGSGGAIVGTFADAVELETLARRIDDPDAVVQEIESFSYPR